MSPPLDWIELIVAGLLVVSGLFVLVAAIGFVRLQDFFLRMHPPALAYTLGSWCVAIAAALYFSHLEGRLALHPLLIPAVLAIIVPVTTVLLARVSLFRQRAAGADGSLSAPTAQPTTVADADPPSG